jgi:2-acylglycerol O-acyltransferase 2
MDLTLEKRKGFVKVALTNGADLVPVISFGENDLFYQVHNSEGTAVRKWQLWFLKKFGFAPCLPYARGIFQYDLGMLPNRRKLTTIVGTPIPVEKVDHPSQEDIDTYHAKYVEALLALYEKYKDKYDTDRKQELRIIR